MAQAIQNVPMVHTGTMVVQGEIVTDKRPPSVRIADAALTAIEAQGLAIVPVEATDAINDSIDFGDSHWMVYSAYRAMNEAGKL